MRLLIIPFLFATVSSFSQKIESDKVDDFNGTRMVITTNEILNGKILKPNYVSVVGNLIISKDSARVDTSITLMFIFKTSVVASTDKNHKVLLKLENGTIVELNNEGNYDIASSDDFLSMISILSDEAIKKLNNSNVVKIRFENSGPAIDIELADKKRAIIRNITTLLSEYKL